MWILYAILAAVTAALVTIFAKVGLKSVDPTFATVVRSIVMAILLIIFGLAYKKFSLGAMGTLSNREWFYIILAGVAGASSWLFGFIALKVAPTAGAVSAIDKMSIVLILVFAALFLGEAFTLKSGIGTVLIAIGSLLIVFK